jgi:hypothetical protein
VHVIQSSQPRYPRGYGSPRGNYPLFRTRCRNTSAVDDPPDLTLWDAQCILTQTGTEHRKSVLLQTTKLFSKSVDSSYVHAGSDNEAKLMGRMEIRYAVWLKRNFHSLSKSANSDTFRREDVKNIKSLSVDGIIKAVNLLSPNTERYQFFASFSFEENCC